MTPIPDSLPAGPFTRAQALRCGLTDRTLKGRRFTRVFPRVWRLSDHAMTWDDQVTAARLTLPDRAQLTGISRLQAAGLDFGPRMPLHFVVEGDLHLDLDGIFLHRTKKLAPIDDEGVNIAAAYLFYCSYARVIDAIKVGDWLLHRGLVSVDEVRTLALGALWRDGAHEAVWVLEHLDCRSRSPKESELRAILDFSGLPTAEVNHDLGLQAKIIGDLVFTTWGLAVEYEGRQHQQDREQYSVDIDRYAYLRAHAVPYIQVTSEKIGQPRTVVGDVYAALSALGYDGPAPEFGERWKSLFRPIRDSLGSRRDWLLAWGGGAVS